MEKYASWASPNSLSGYFGGGDEMNVVKVLNCDEPFFQLDDPTTSELGEMWFSRNQVRLTKEQH